MDEGFECAGNGHKCVLEKVEWMTFGQSIRIDQVCGFYVIGQILKLAKLFNDLSSGHESGRGWLVICLSVESGGGLTHLGGKSSSVFKYGCGEVGGVVKISSRGVKGEGFPAQSVGSSNTDVLDSPCLLVLITETSQSRQHESCKSPTAELFEVDSGRISIRHCEY
ncbi:hypothetical protein Tco_0955136 [Tanacetum coccineum]|uniref:Uncharacterized protein n=1 Tax=Tanacetum coccineum TaxID=301880 RepID=A0ABQ5E6F2_9ASTR